MMLGSSRLSLGFQEVDILELFCQIFRMINYEKWAVNTVDNFFFVSMGIIN